MSFWTFTDIFEEPGFDSNAWAQTFGIQTKYGVPKPAYRALQLLARFPKVSEAHMCGASRCTAPNQATPSTLPLVHCPARRPHMLFPHKIQLFLGPTFPLPLVFFFFLTLCRFVSLNLSIILSLSFLRAHKHHKSLVALTPRKPCCTRPQAAPLTH